MIKNFRTRPTTLRRPVIALSIAAAFGLAGAGTAQAQVSVDVGVTASEPGWLYDLGDVISLFVEPPMAEPEPVAVAWAPPPMLVEEVPPQPDPYAVWTGGYWTWQGDWVWCAGRWMDPPRREYVWVEPYYEHRDDRVIFIPGYWSTPDAEFIAPPMDRPVAWAYVNEGVVIGPPPEGPVGIFVPPPPGSRPGLIIPAPIGTPPAVVISAPPVMAVGMRVTGSVPLDARRSINDNRPTSYAVANLRRVAHVTVEAPATATAGGRAFQAQVPHQPHLAAAMHPQVVARAPRPTSTAAVPAYVPGRTVAALPAPQKVQGLPKVPSHAAATVPPAARAQMAHAPLTPAEAREARAGGRDLQHLPPTAAGPQGAHPAAPNTPQEQAPQRAAQERAQQEAQQHAQQQQAQQQEAQRVERSQQEARQNAQEQAQQRAQLQQAQRAEQQQAQQRSQQEAQQRAEQQHAQQAEQQRAQQEAQQRSQQQAQQRAQQEQAQRAEQQRAQQEAQQRAQQQAQQRAQQEQAQRAEQQRVEQQRAQQEAQQRAQQQAEQRAQQAQAQRAEQQRAQQEQAQRVEQQRAEQQRAQQDRGERARPRGEEASRPSN